MRSILLQVVVLALGQISGATIRTGDVARQLTADDIAKLEEMVGAKPWLLEGNRPLGPPTSQNIQTIRAYFAPTMSTFALRRGAYMTFTREFNPDPGPWKGIGSARPYAQIAVSGRPYEQIESDLDLNRPFTVTGSFQDEELVELVTFVRSNPGVIPAGRGRGNVGTLPISSVERLQDGSVTVGWSFNFNEGQTAVLEKRGANWVVISLARFRIIFD